jgi:hypothetical protein
VLVMAVSESRSTELPLQNGSSLLHRQAAKALRGHEMKAALVVHGLVGLFGPPTMPKMRSVVLVQHAPPGSGARFAGPRRQLFRQREGAYFPSCLDWKVIPSFVRYRRLISER